MVKISGKKIVKTIDKFIDLLVLLFLLSFFLYGAYSMWDTNRVYSQANPAAYIAYHPTREEMGFEQLRAINPDVFGWITVFGTNIDYPLVQGNDNQRYVHTNARGEPALSGAIFLDFRNKRNFTDFNNIIYGHDMAAGAMFGEIASFEQEYFFESRKFGKLFSGENYYGIEFFAFLAADAHDSEIYNPTVDDPAIKQMILQRFLNEAIQYRVLDITIADRLVVLSTCTPTSTNGRHLLIGRLIEEIPEDTFVATHRGQGINGISDISILEIVIGIVFLNMLTVAITLLISKKKKKKETPEEVLKTANQSVMKKKRTTLLSDIAFLFGKITMVVIMITLLFTFAYGVIQVDDFTMMPAIREGDIMLFQRFSSDLIATDIVIVSYNGQTQVRRVVAVAGDTVDITDQGLIINGLLQQELHIFVETTQFVEGITFPLIVPEQEVFVLGDNRAYARDSRFYGTIRIDDILGNVVTVIRRRNL